MARCVGLTLILLMVACRGEGKTHDEDSVPPQVGDVVITELAAPVGELAEWFEVRNVGARAYAPGELWLSNGSTRLPLNGDDALEPGAYAVLSHSALEADAHVTHTYDMPIYDWDGGLIQVLAGELELDAVTYGGEGVGSPLDDMSLALDPVAEAAAQNDLPGRWCLTLQEADTMSGARWASPGEQNPSCANLDYDADGYGLEDGDCDDADPNTHPHAEEVWYDGVDQNCNEQSDYDADKDGYDAEAYGGYDCDDANEDLRPDARETCDEVDNDCDGAIDDEDGNLRADRYYVDEDGDGYGQYGAEMFCEPPGEGYTTLTGDCDDEDPSIHPGAQEIWYDGVDQDCTLSGDYDADEDGYPATAYGGDDCDDWTSSVHPGATETCNGYDDDCDGDVDDADAERRNAPTWYLDEDGDGYGQRNSDYEGCLAPSGYAAADGDCADDDPTVYPGAEEVWYDGLDQDCDFWSDDDADQDGYDVGDTSVDPNADCDDSDPFVHPDAPHYVGLTNVECDPTVLLTGLSTVSASAAGTGLGDAVSSAGDLDGDGVADLLMGAPAADSDSDAEAGLVWVVLGGASAAPDLSAPVATLHGVSNGDAAGEALAGLGDLDGDGYDDVGVGASGVDDVGSAAGAAYVCTGPVEGDLVLSEADAIWLGALTRDTAGRALAASGDGDEDGVAELYVAAPNEDTAGGSSGAVYWLASGLDGGGLADASGIWTGERTGDRAGTDLAGAGDVDGDGVDDLWVGADNGSDSTHTIGPGVVWLVSGVSSGTLSLADAAGRIEGLSDDDELGAGLASLGDLDGDGYADLWVGAPGLDSGGGLADAGGAWLIPGPVSGAAGVSSVAVASVEGEEAGARVGASVAGFGDLDEDGLAELIVGAPDATGGATGSGMLWVLPGSITGAQTLSDLALDTQVGVSEDEAAATALAGVGDVSGDGQPDLLVGLPGRDRMGAVALIGPP